MNEKILRKFNNISNIYKEAFSVSLVNKTHIYIGKREKINVIVQCRRKSTIYQWESKYEAWE